MAFKQIPKTMLALVHNQNLKTLNLRNSEPIPILKPDEYLLKVDSVALTNGELLWPRPTELNESNPGVEMAGQVATAPTSSKFQPGAKIYMRTTFPRSGSAREYSIGLENELARRPDNISANEAATVPVSSLTAWQALFVQAGLEPRFDKPTANPPQKKTRVLVNGASGNVGLWMTQLAHAAGCFVVGTASTRNASLVRAYGADDIIDYTKTTIPEWVKQGKGSTFDLVLDTVGRGSLTQAWHAAREHGLVLSIVPADDMVWKWDLDRPEGISESIQGKFFIMEPNGEQLLRVTELIESGKVRPVLDSVYKLDEYRAAFDRVGSGKAVGKIVIQITD